MPWRCSIENVSNNELCLHECVIEVPVIITATVIPHNRHTLLYLSKTFEQTPLWKSYFLTFISSTAPVVSCLLISQYILSSQGTSSMPVSLVILIRLSDSYLLVRATSKYQTYMFICWLNTATKLSFPSFLFVLLGKKHCHRRQVEGRGLNSTHLGLNLWPCSLKTGLSSLVLSQTMPPSYSLPHEPETKKAALFFITSSPFYPSGHSPRPTDGDLLLWLWFSS